MDQQDLRRLENQCIQENLPECTAACPLHIDVRAFIGHMAKEDWAESLKILRKTMPLPNILGRICDAPCEVRCKRREAGGAIRIGALERVCVSQPSAPQKPLVLPARGKRIAVIGSGMSSLTAAWDSLRKGYRVKIFEPGKGLGTSLEKRHSDLLPREVIESETDLLFKLGCEVEWEAPISRPDFLDRCLESSDALYLGLDALPDLPWELERDPMGLTSVEPLVHQTSRDRVFAGGLPHDGKDSPVQQAAEGRWAANSIDRFLQKVSLTAGREKEGPTPTRLFTSLADVVHQPAVKMNDPYHGYTPEEAIEEAKRCIQCQCLECVKVCVYLERFGSYPKKYAREIYNNESIVIGTRQSNKLVNSCSLCGLCEAVCPEDFAMQDLCLQSRQGMVQRGKMPPSAHEFALSDMAFSQSERFALARHEPGYSESHRAFFPGCQLSGSSPDQVMAVYAHLRGAFTGGVGLILGCCAAPAWWAGEQDLFNRQVEELKTKWHSLGKPDMILACSTCLGLFKEHLPEIPVVSLWPVLEDTWIPSRIKPVTDEVLAIHDPCTTRHEPFIQGSVRRLLKKLAVTVEELKLGRDLTECCGYGGLMQDANPVLAREVIKTRARRSEKDYITYCAVCRDSLASVNKRAFHLLDLLFPDPELTYPSLRKKTGWSERQENRARLKDRLLEELWSEKPMEKKEHQKIKLLIAPGVRALLEERRILDEDLQRVIQHAEESGEKFYNASTERFKAAFRPYKAMFWVEYRPSEDGFIVFNAYLHRMELTA